MSDEYDPKQHYYNGHGRQSGFGERGGEIVASHFVGYRTWAFDREHWFLHGMTVKNYMWVAGRNQAICFRKNTPSQQVSKELENFHQGQRVPVKNCGCGFWAYSNVDSVPRSWKTSARSLVGVIQGWGKVIFADQGFRCEFARIVALWPKDPSVVTPTLRAGYPGVKWFEDMEEMFFTFPSTDTKQMM